MYKQTLREILDNPRLILPIAVIHWPSRRQWRILSNRVIPAWDSNPASVLLQREGDSVATHLPVDIREWMLRG